MAQEEVKSYSQMRQEFYEKYVKRIVPVVKMYENERKCKLFLLVVFSCLSAIGSVFLIYKTIFCGTSHPHILYFAFVLLILPFIFGIVLKKCFEYSIKPNIMPIVCSCFENLTWSSGAYLNGKFFSLSGAIPRFDFENYKDILIGSYRGLDIEIIESNYSRIGSEENHTVFKGVVVKLDMKKSFSSHTIIKPSTLAKNSSIQSLKQINLQDNEFDKKFDIFTNDENDAKNLVTPSFMERLKNIQSVFSAYNASCAFYNNYLVLALSTSQDLLSLCKLTKEIDDSTQFFQIYEEIISIIKLIDYFKLNQKIGL